MTMMQYLSTFRIYSPSVLILAAGVTLTCSLLKKTVLKNCPKKLFLFLPFAVGLAFYAAFHAIVAGVCEAVAYSLSQTLEGGFACGCAATLYYVAYEQFFRKQKKTANPISPLLEGVVPEEKREEIAETLYAEGGKTPKEQLAAYVEETLRQHAEPSLSEAEILASAKIVEAFLLSLNKG